MPSPRWEPIPEPELTPYRALTTLPVQRLLVLAPHPDDEIFGCGGLLALAVQQGAQAHVAVVSDGAAAGSAALREQESCAAARAIAGGSPALAPVLDFWRLPDRGVVPDAALVARIRAALAASNAQWLLAPSPFEIHPDHRAVCLAAIEAAEDSAAQLGFYEVGQPLLPNRLIDITAVLERKRAAMACFASQLAIQQYDDHVQALNRYRAYTLGDAVSHAEALWFPPAGVAGAPAVLAALTGLLARRLGLC